MDGQLTLALMAALPVLLVPAMLVWYLNVRGLHAILGKHDWQGLFTSRW